MGLGEDSATVGEVDRERRGDVTSVHAPRRDDVDRERVGDVLRETHLQSRPRP